MSEMQPLALLWNDQHVADLSDAMWSDFPWRQARIVFVNLTPEIRAVLEWLADVSDADELPGPSIRYGAVGELVRALTDGREDRSVATTRRLRYRNRGVALRARSPGPAHSAK